MDDDDGKQQSLIQHDHHLNKTRTCTLSLSGSFQRQLLETSRERKKLLIKRKQINIVSKERNDFTIHTLILKSNNPILLCSSGKGKK